MTPRSRNQYSQSTTSPASFPLTGRRLAAVPQAPQRQFQQVNQSSSVRRLPARPALPIWLRLLMRLQQGSAIVAIGIGIAVAAAYSSTVYIQQVWGAGYRTLKQQERDQRQMRTVGEVIKDQLAQQAAQPDSGLTNRTPEQMIFLPRSPQPPTPPAATSNPAADPRSSSSTPVSEPASTTPLGY